MSKPITTLEPVLVALSSSFSLFSGTPLGIMTFSNYNAYYLLKDTL
jgi:hypothetical protein